MSMHMIPVTFFHRPNGLPELTKWETADQDIAAKAVAIMERGLNFEAETLRTRQTSLTIADRKEGVDLHIQICPLDQASFNDAMRALITEAYGELTVQ
ncbi:MAG: hypothetical protein ACR2RE_05260 [Geminicoccaceae bacterium]